MNTKYTSRQRSNGKGYSFTSIWHGPSCTLRWTVSRNRFSQKSNFSLCDHLTEQEWKKEGRSVQDEHTYNLMRVIQFSFAKFRDIRYRCTGNFMIWDESKRDYCCILMRASCCCVMPVYLFCTQSLCSVSYEAMLFGWRPLDDGMHETYCLVTTSRYCVITRTIRKSHDHCDWEKELFVTIYCVLDVFCQPHALKWLSEYMGCILWIKTSLMS